MLRNRGNAESRWVWQSNGFSVHGDGVTPEHPIAEAGGVHVVRCDVEIPAITAGNQADWHNSYPGSYAINSFDLDLLRYVNPLDSAPKLHGKGNLLLLQSTVLQGAACTGAAAPTQAGGTIDAVIKTFGGSVNAWDYNAAMPATVGVVTPTSRVSDFIFGTDSGVSPRLVFRFQAITNNIVAGRWRIILMVAEV